LPPAVNFSSASLPAYPNTMSLFIPGWDMGLFSFSDYVAVGALGAAKIDPPRGFCS
jgi:hypothetical protein